jgi:YidC/Oxa1 family membrane protein insertase
MFTIEQRVRNKGTAQVELRPYGLISRAGTPDVLGFYLLHEGLLGVLDGTLEEVDYDDLQELEEEGAGGKINYETTGGWLGITDKFWLVVLIPDQETSLAASFRIDKTGPVEKYQADFMSPAMKIPAGGTVVTTTRIFAGAKVVRLLDDYQEKYSIDLFDRAVDFGWFYFLTRPIFFMLDWFYGVLGNFGLAILALTVTIKLLFFPLANKSYRAMSKMKLLQPKMVEMREKYGDDRMRLNQEMMALYKREKVNPASGCLPILLQLPVFFALYKVLFVTIEMRQAPFYGWITDLSARDPLGVLTAFGLIEWNVPGSIDFLNIGIWPIAMGLTMFFQQKLNPPPPDPMQAKLFLMLPLVFTFILAPFPAGLVIYWTWNNLLTIGQQWVIMRGVKRAQEAPPVKFEVKPPEPEPEPEPESEPDSEAAPSQLTKPKPKKKKSRKRR